MTSLAALLISTAAIMHAYWNLLGKRQVPSAAFFFIASLAGAVVLAPLLIYDHLALASIPAPVWRLVVASAVFEAIYYVGLGGAYRNGDMSIVYPLARALPVIMVTVTSVVLGIGKPIGAAGLLGILGVTAGCLILPLRRLRDVQLNNYLNTWCLLAAMAALGTTGYTLIDNEALRQLRLLSFLDTVQLSLLYLGLTSIISTCILGVYIAFSAKERVRLHEIREQGMRWAVLAGLIICAGYGMVLVAMAHVSNISYIAAFRQLSIPLGATLGVVVQKEPIYKPKVFGTIGVLLGLILVILA
jgi:drug/metabolite transporter (DMT)-like permease